MQLILEEIIKFQSYYLYLEPIFNAPEINKELAKEKADFIKVQQFWDQLLFNLDASAWGLAEFMEKENHKTQSWQ